MAGTNDRPPAYAYKAVLFGSGDDFNGMSAIIDGVSFYRTRALSGVELVNDQVRQMPRRPRSWPRSWANFSLL